MTRWPRVHVLLVNYNRWQDTVECLESLLRIDYPDVRIIVCDNGSADGSLERFKAWADGRIAPSPTENGQLRPLSWPPAPKPVPYRVYTRGAAEQTDTVEEDEPRLVFIQMGANLGFTGANNTGFRYLIARRALGETGYVWVLNNDTVVAPDALRQLVEVAQTDERIGAVGARLLHYHSPDELQAAGGGCITRWNGMARLLTDKDGGVGSPEHPKRLDYVHGASMLVPLPVLERVGLFDDRYFVYSEETDWCFRLRDEGLRMAYCPTATVWHKEGMTMGRRSPFQDYLVVRNTLLFMLKFLAPFLPLAFLHSIYRSFLPKLFRGEWRRLGAVARAYRDFVREAARGPTDTRAPTVHAAVRRLTQRKAS